MDTPCHSSWCSQSCGAAVVVLVLMLLGLGGWPGRVAASSVLLTLDVPTATQLYGLTTFVAINDPGQILGYDLGTSGTYLLTNPAAPIPTRQAIACPGLEADTAGEDVNRYGEVAGRCGTSGFVLTRAGVYRLLVYPGLQSSSGTWATALNNRRQVVGSYELDGFWHGFRWEGGRYTTLDVPFPDATQTFPTTINHEGDVAGYYFANHPDYPGYGKTYGFIVRGGVFEQIEVPHPSVTHTWIWDINDLGHVLGRFHAEDATTFLASDFILIDGTFYYATLPGPPHVRTRLTSTAFRKSVTSSDRFFG